MNAEKVIEVLEIPDSARIDKRIPKKLLLEQGIAYTSDKKQINDCIEELSWVAALKPNNIGVKEYQDESRHYEEIAIVKASLRGVAKTQRLSELIHRAIPYPTLLIFDETEGVTISVAHKRLSQGHKGKVVIEKLQKTNRLNLNALTTAETDFLQSLAFKRQSLIDLFTAYDGWLGCLIALEVATITGLFSKPTSPDHLAYLEKGLNELRRVRQQIASKRTKAAKEKQINKRTDLNISIKKLDEDLRKISKALLCEEVGNPLDTAIMSCCPIEEKRDAEV